MLRIRRLMGAGAFLGVFAGAAAVRAAALLWCRMSAGCSTMVNYSIHQERRRALSASSRHSFSLRIIHTFLANFLRSEKLVFELQGSRSRCIGECISFILTLLLKTKTIIRMLVVRNGCLGVHNRRHHVAIIESIRIHMMLLMISVLFCGWFCL